METYSLNEIQLAEYCRKKGLFKEQVKAWREGCLNANSPKPVDQSKQLNHELKEEKNRSKILEKDLRKKEKALAEAAALLLLRKKAQAIWGDQEDE
ncbi:transposase [Anaerobacillus isosaccharinicus]|uniref:Transposase n=1 Tax=Anaerobacillus isosaccharinicus TaxID=1532552 RepID=A0A7S7LB38_9BACI|nr:transposase [Anaerobacillus isosaccharinicus]QOY37727.1 transposase [Anaerobacillus isosaccharinicus]